MPGPAESVWGRLMSDTGDFLGYGFGDEYGDPEWPDRDRRRVERAVEFGVGQVYRPPVLPGEPAAHAWGFLRPVGEATLASGERSANLPDDFGGFEGDCRMDSSDGVAYQPVAHVHSARVDACYSAAPSTTGRPLYAAEQAVRGVTAERANRSRLYVFPQADAAYTLRFDYYVRPPDPSASRPHVYGGADYPELFQASCRAACEQLYDNVSGGPLYRLFLEKLAQAVSADRRRRGERLGYNGDGRRGGFFDRGDPFGTGVTVYGQQY